MDRNLSFVIPNDASTHHLEYSSTACQYHIRGTDNRVENENQNVKPTLESDSEPGPYVNDGQCLIRLT